MWLYYHYYDSPKLIEEAVDIPIAQRSQWLKDKLHRLREYRGGVNASEALKLVEIAKKICIDNGVDEINLDVQTFDVPLNNNQKFVYVLSHSYSIRQADGTFTYFEYLFEPQSSNTRCVELKEKLKLEPKYKYQANRDYSLYPPDGFCIDKYRLDCIFFPLYKNLVG